MPNKRQLEFRFLIKRADYPALFDYISACSGKIRATELCILAGRELDSKSAGVNHKAATAVRTVTTNQSLPLRFKLKEADFSELYLHLQTFSVKTRAIILCLLAQSALQIPASAPGIAHPPLPAPPAVPFVSVPDDLDQFVMH
jgi:hypothetical protein